MSLKCIYSFYYCDHLIRYYRPMSVCGVCGGGCGCYEGKKFIRKSTKTAT